MKSLTKIRVFPLTIFFATLVLTIKISDIREGVDGIEAWNYIANQ